MIRALVVFTALSVILAAATGCGVTKDAHDVTTDGAGFREMDTAEGDVSLPSVRMEGIQADLEFCNGEFQTFRMEYAVVNDSGEDVILDRFRVQSGDCSLEQGYDVHGGFDMEGVEIPASTRMVVDCTDGVVAFICSPDPLATYWAGDLDLSVTYHYRGEWDEHTMATRWTLYVTSMLDSCHGPRTGICVAP